jgi:hypothetical protein
MKNKVAIFVVVMELVTGITFSAAPILAQSLLSKTANIRLKNSSQLVVFSELGLVIPQPVGFEKATSFYGFQQSETSSSVLLAVIPGPFKEVIKGFNNKKSLATKGIILLSQQPIKIKNQPGYLLEISQNFNGLEVRKWTVVFGDERKTNMVTATFLKKDSAKLSASLKKVVLAVSPLSRPTSASVSSLPFSVTAVDGLMLVQKAAGLGKIALFTNNGQIPAASPADPLFMVTPSLGAVPVLDRQAFAIRRLSGYPETKILAVKSTKKITIDNLSGWEIVADAQDQSTKTSLQLYQVMLFPKEGGYVLMIGTVGDKQSVLYLPKFKAMALSYKNLVKRK